MSNGRSDNMETADPNNTETASPKSAKIVCMYANHLDLVWRRCWRRPTHHLGQTYRSYADLEDVLITAWLNLAVNKGAAFQLEQALSLREYLRRHPVALAAFRKLSQEGRFELLGSGEAIIDVNMCMGETMARNLASGVWYARETLGRSPVLACHTDGFGSSAQFPQVIRQCGMRGINGMGYKFPDAPYWRGLDGSTVLARFPAKGGFAGDWPCYDPCRSCKGDGTTREGDRCEECGGTGLRLSQTRYPSMPWINNPDFELGVFSFIGEETYPDERLPDLFAERNALGKEQYVWGTRDALLPLWQADLDRVDDPDAKVSSSVENNPVMTGTYVTRIGVKQAGRKAEGFFYAAEKLTALAGLGPDSKEGKALASAWLELPLIFFHDSVNGTHQDAAYLELIDSAQGVVDVSRRVGASAARKILGQARSETPSLSAAAGDGEMTVAVFNPHGFEASLPVELEIAGERAVVTDSSGKPMPVYAEPADEEPVIVAQGLQPHFPAGPGYWAAEGVAPPRTVRFLAANVPPLSLKTFRVKPRAPQAAGAPAAPKPIERSVEFAGYRLGWDGHGVRSIVDLASGAELMNGEHCPAGSLILEQDIGDPWGTRSLDRPRVSLVDQTQLLGARQKEDAAELFFAGTTCSASFKQDPMVWHLYWYQRVRLLRGLPWVEFDYDVFWNASERRVRVVFPSRSTVDKGLYRIPYGVLSRDRYEMTGTGLPEPDGAWPATFFAATEPSGGAPGIAVLNDGTPSARIEDGALMYSVLRSPGFIFCLTMNFQTNTLPFYEMHDRGYHRFRFGLMPFTGENLPEVLRAGDVFNHPAPAVEVGRDAPDFRSGISVDAPGVHVTALKPAYPGNGATAKDATVLRFVELLGQERDVTISLPRGATAAWLANLLEEPQREIPVKNGKVTVPVRPYMIGTLLLR